MILGESLKTQLAQYLSLLENPLTLSLSLDTSEEALDMKAFAEEVAFLSDKISLEYKELTLTPSFSISRENEHDKRIIFAGIPLGHEFESFVLALLQVGGRAPKISDEQIEKIKLINENLNFETIVSLTCHNCPDVVQALNIMAVLNPKISHTMIEGGTFKDLVEDRSVLAVPSVFLNGEEFMAGKTSLDEILDRLVKNEEKDLSDTPTFDVLIIGGGPAASTAAIYAARKGFNTGLVCDRFGGQVKETLGIENITGQSYTEGPKYMEQVKEHVKSYNVDIFEGYMVEEIIEKSPLTLKLNKGGNLSAKTVIVATGARWRLLGIPGELEFRNKGIAYCTHCDGPLFRDKKVAVIGGGNSGIESAIDLASLAKEVVVFEFMDSLKADDVLQERLRSLPNVEIITSAQTTSLNGDKKLRSISYTDRNTGQSYTREIDGCFIQVGLVPNTEFLSDKVEKTRMGEIIVDSHGATKIDGLFAAGDCANTPFKQIVIAQGSGATAALGAFNYLMRK